MQTLTFTQKLLRQRRFLSSLIPLLALFVGLGSARTAQAQVTITSTNVFIQRNGAATETFNVNPAVPVPFNRANLGSYDFNTGQLVLKGASVTTSETGTIRAAGAQLNYTVFDSNFNVITSNFVTLQGGAAINGNRTFSSSTQNIDLVSLSRPTGAGTPYILAVDFSTTQRVGTRISTGPVDDNGGLGYDADYSITGGPIVPTNLSNSNVFINTTGTTTPNTTYGASSGTIPLFQGANLGTYDINTGKLTLNGGNITTFESNGDAVQGVRVIYRIIKPVQPGTPTTIIFPLSNIPLIQVGSPATVNGGTSRFFENTTALRNLISGLANSGTGTFNISVSYEADVLRNGGIVPFRDDNGGPGYTATFMTTGNPIQTVTWTGKNDDNWFNASNWDLNRIPDIVTNVVIPNFGTGDASPYPNIFSNQSYLNTPNPTVSTTRVTVNNANSGPALARNLSLLGESSTVDRSILRLQPNSVLKIYGDFSNRFLSYITRDNSNTWFASGDPQNIAQASYATLTVSGGGTKAVTGIANVGEQFVFDSSTGNTIVTTDSQNPGGSLIQLADRLAVNNNQGASIIGETDNSYVLGLVQTRRANVLANEGSPRTLGNIGFGFEFVGSSDPGDVNVTRSNVQNYFFSGSRVGVRRVFGVQPTNLGRPGFNLRANVTFSVLPNETKNLSPSNATIPEQNLVLFLSKNNGGTFGNLGRDGAVVNYTVSKNDVTDFATFTLGDRQNPLPVRLTAFDAKRLGNDALVTWQTASEQNSKGYEVQVSTNGKEFRTLSFVPSATPNSTSRTNYSYVDKEANKVGQRYYRLRQVDVDEKDAYFGPAIVNFEGKVAASSSALVAYPNPVKNGEQLRIAVQSVNSGAGQVSIIDMTGRTIRQESVSLNSGVSDISIAQFNELKSGMYIIRVALPSGENQTLRVMKQ